MIQDENWIPNNLPPRSQFIGREKAKARVHEALRSRSYLISIDGIGGIGKTSLALEVAYECLQVSQYVKQLNQSPSAPASVFEQESLDLPPELYNRLQRALLKCGPFESDIALRSVFVDARISPWRDAFPEVHRRNTRVSVIIDELLQHYTPTSENALVLFLRVLQEKVSPADACYSELITLVGELAQHLNIQNAALPVSSELPTLDPSLDVNTIAHFEGFIWTTAKDHDLTLEAILDAVARILDYPGIVQKPFDERRIAVEKLLRLRPYLLIVDNFETISDDAVRDFLLNLPEPSKALITTREQKLSRVWAISLKGLTEVEALTLMRSEGKRLGMQALERAEDVVLSRLYQATGGAPLAIKWAVGQITQRGQSLDTVLTALHNARGNIFDYIFSRSWDLLSEDVQLILMLMSLFATSASRAGIEAASDVHHYALDEALGQLVKMSLIDATDELELTQRRYGIHPLTRAFAGVKLQQATDVKQRASRKLINFYLAFTKENGGYWNSKGFKSLDSELPNILMIIQRCYDYQRVKQALDIFYNITDFMTIRGYWDKAMSLGKQALTAALENQNDVYAAMLRVWPIGWLYRHRGDLVLSEEQVRQALLVLEQYGGKSYIAYAKRNLGRIAHERGNLEEAEQILSETLDYYKSLGDTRHIHFVTANLAAVALERDDLDKAWVLCNDVLETARSIDDPERLANLLRVLGGVAQRRGNLAIAQSFWREALDNMRIVNRPDGIADCLFDLSQVEIEMGNLSLAHQMLLEALESYRRLDITPRIQEVKTIIAILEKESQINEQ